MRCYFAILLLPIMALAQDSVDSTEEQKAPATTAQEQQETQPEDRDFKPSEEISEDFPVPLPSDI
ncbi:MAG: hypothetical protein ACPH3I_04210 [Porticoccaceae bacterium]